MERPGSDSFIDVMISSIRSAGFWSAISAIVGVIAFIGGGILYLTIDEISDFSITVIVIGLALLVLALVLSPRAVAMFLVGRQGRYGSNVIIMTVAFFVIIILVNFLMFRSPIRLDVTATRVFTLAPQTIQVLEELDTTVMANAFFIPGGSNSALEQQRAEDLLNEFARRSSNFNYRFIDPELRRSVAEQFNVTSYPTIVFEDVVRGTQQPVSSFTEQGFVTGILVSTGVEQKRIYYLTGHQEASMTRDIATGEVEDEGFDFALQGMQRDNYIVLSLNLKQFAQVPSNAAVLVIAGPKQDMDSNEQAAITEYMMGGGRVVALFDPDTPESFVNLISQWGVTLGGFNVADAVSNVAGEALTPLVQKANGQYIPNSIGIPITDQIDVTFFPEVTSIVTVLAAEDMPPQITVIPLAMSTPASWLETNPDNVGFDAAEDALGPFILVAAVQALGTIDQDPEEAFSSENETKFVVFGDSDFARNNFFFSSDNADLFLNSVNWLADDYDLISIRPKLLPFRELVLNSRERDFIKWSSWFFPPAVMMLLGGFVWWRRR
ncbi:MAG: GldG family protein [Chloroflexi bacterium]|nr:GldG family protein [Chloroflexota bacterium]